MADNLQSEIYTKFLQDAELTNVDRETLKAKRGFLDKIIDKFKFVSSQKDNRKIINNLRNDYEDQALLKYGILEEVNDNLRPCSMLLDDRIIIPYLDESGEKATLLRPHKLGLKGVNIQPYCPFLLRNKPKHIVLTEGEFKAVALAQWEIPGIAIPGIQSFSGTHFDKLVDFLKEHKVKKITVIFDNEVKDNPDYKNYKEKPEDRWDTPFWACVMQDKLKKESFNTKISWLPDDWQENGKIDFDAALAQGRTYDEIIEIKNKRKKKDKFINSLPKEGQKIVRRKLVDYLSKGPVERELNRYLIWKTAKGGSSYPDYISNFVINIKSSFFTPDGVMRYVQFVNEFGEKSKTFVLEPSDMAGVGKFKEYCFSRGNYIWEGSGSDLQEVWKYELRRDTGDMIYTPEVIGEIEPGFWLFGNIAVKNGKVYHPDSDGIFWIESIGYKPQSLSVGPRGETMEDAIPSLYLDDKEVDIVEIAETLKNNLGGYEAYVGLGWVIATIFSRVIFEEFDNFPFLFLHGKRESGKTTFLKWLMSFFGLETDGTSIHETSQNYIMRVLSYFSSMGVWFDEYRNTRKVTQNDGYLRSAYNRQLSGKGIKSPFGAKAYKVKATLALSGEELPKDSGLFTRLVPLQMSANKRNREYYERLKRMTEKFSGFTLYLIKNYDEYKDEIISTIKELRSALVKQEITDRTAQNWAVIAGAFYATVKEDQKFIEWVLKSCQEVRKTAEDEHILNIFWNDVVIMHSDFEINDKHVTDYYDKDKELIAIWFPAVYNIWAKYYRSRTGKEPFDKASISSYIKDESYYVDNKTVRLNGKVRGCYLIEPEKGPKLLEELKAAVIEQKKR